MSAIKLIINKFEDDINFKTLNILIQDDSSVAEFSDWQDGNTLQAKKVSERSSRLVVKIVSGVHNSRFNLDACAKELQNNLDIRNEKFTDTEDIFIALQEKCKVKMQTSHSNNTHEEIKRFTISKNRPNIISDRKNTHNNLKNNYNFSTINPLEYGLERVKANNAKIMQNINLLNRTLYYTKKKENLNIYPKSIRTFPCNICGKCFVYETGLKRHYTVQHTIAELQPRWQVVWTCIQCYQVWPRQVQAIRHSIECFKCENAECVREIKASSLLQCEFCEKVFTSIPRLLKHSKTHSTSKNYECNTCGLSFVSYKVAQHHWLTCPWLQQHYNFSLPKLLLCNACDRKFRNYDQLYNHRYKVGHFIMKTHNNDMNTLSILVYQCETCAQWFQSIPSLTSHKSQCLNLGGHIIEEYENGFPGNDNQENYCKPENEYGMTNME